MFDWTSGDAFVNFFSMLSDRRWYKDIIIYELNNRPGWTKIPMQGILQLLETT